MTAEQNVIPMPEQEADVPKQIRKAAANLGALFNEFACQAILRLQEAEKTGLARIEEYVPQDRLLTLKEAAAYLGFKPRTVESWTKPGSIPTLPFIVIGGHKRFRKTALDRRLDELEVRGRTIKL